MPNDVKVHISLRKTTGEIGFGIPLLLSGMETTAKPYTECSSVDDVKALFPEGTEVFKAAQLIFIQDNAPEKIAVCGSLEKATASLSDIYDRGWRQLIVTSVGTEGEDTIQEIAAYIEAKGDKMFFASVSDLAALTGENAITSLDRTVLLYYKGDVKNPVSALVGATAGKKAGSFTYKNQILKGLAPLELTEGEITAAHKAGCLTFVTKSDDNVTTEGKTAGGEYVDIIDSKDYIISQIVYQTQRALNTADKIPYTNGGISLLESVCVNVLQDAFNNGVIATTPNGLPDYSVNYLPRDETDIHDRQNRRYVAGNFRFKLAGAIHEMDVYGTIDI